MKTALLYLALVGLPVLGVLAILRAGQRLDPPVAFGGMWRVEMAVADSTPRTCRPPAALLHVEQSGERARVRLGAGSAVGEVTGGRLATRSALAVEGDPTLRPGPGTCAGWRLDARPAGSRVPVILSGQLTPEGCPCAPVAFTAQRAATSDGEDPAH